MQIDIGNSVKFQIANFEAVEIGGDWHMLKKSGKRAIYILPT